MTAARYTISAMGAFVTAAVLAFGVATLAATQIEDRSVEAVDFALREQGLDWVTVTADGLQVRLDGTAPDEATRFRVVSLAGSIVDADRVIDRLDVTDPDSFVPPEYALEMLRNEDGISLIGLVPESPGSGAIVEAMPDLSGGAEVVDMIETAAYAEPETWADAVEFGLLALRTLPRSKVSVTAASVLVEAVSDSPEERADFVATLEAQAPDGIEVVLDISAPRPVITPFTLRFVRTGDTARFEACSADTQRTADRILAAAREAGLSGRGSCEIGLGMPSPRWAEAVQLALEAVSELGTATVTFSDADITLIAAEGYNRDDFDRIAGQLDAALPEVFSLHAVLPEASENNEPAGPPNVTATLSEDGTLDLRGRLPDERIEAAVLSFARARFGNENVRPATRRVEDLPTGWPVRVLAGLDALSRLNSGSVRIEPDIVTVSGQTGSLSAVSDISRLLSQQLGDSANFEIDVDYVEALDPAAAIPEPEECVERINAILDETKITFDPGSVEINEEAGAVLDRIAEVLPDCRHAAMEIGGHTDSQGRESMNLRLSQSRADAVLNGLMARNILIGNLTARGYGESQPIADNDTEDGRETNRRIEFRLIDPDEAASEVSEEGDDLSPPADMPQPTPRPDRPADEESE
ncbi:OmpA family protein [Rhodobacterales bacterium HKCCE3408]|nr:OmpA family protein [Rhodobacterales bacterium HKCCE3408]